MGISGGTFTFASPPTKMLGGRVPFVPPIIAAPEATQCLLEFKFKLWESVLKNRF